MRAVAGLLASGIFVVLVIASGGLTAKPGAAGVNAGEFRIDFVIDRTYDVDTAYGLLRGYDPGGHEKRAKGMGIPADLAERIGASKDFAEVRGPLVAWYDARYHEVAPALACARQEFVDLWKPLAKPFADAMAAVTGHAMFHPTYTCVVSAIHRGISSWESNRIAAGFDLDTAAKVRGVAFETAVSHVFHLVRAGHDRNDLDDWRVWAFSEVSATLVLGQPAFKSLWPDLTDPAAFFLNRYSGYTQLGQLREDLTPIWDGRKSFADYLERSVSILKRTPIAPGR
jgi:hypothetical protein